MAHRPLRRLRRTRTAQAAALLIGLAVLAGCTSTVTGAAGRDPGAAATVAPSAKQSSASTVDPIPGDHITVPPGGAASAAATSGGSAVPTAALTAATSPSGTPAPVPSGLEKFYGQQLQWTGCASYALTTADVRAYSVGSLQCARMTVPLDYSRPTGPTISVAVMRKKATGTQRIGSLVTDPGGPGDSGLDFLSTWALQKVVAPLNQNFDLIGFDPRGVGSSVPAIKCYTGADWDTFRQTDPRSATAAQVAADNRITQQYVADCVARSGTGTISGPDFLPHVGTADAVKDLDVLRAVLGEPRLTYLGYSYGTQLGYVYAEQFPKNIRAMILDGVVSPTAETATSQIEQQQSFQKAFSAFAAWCAQNTQGCPVGTDPTAFSSRYQQLVRPLLTSPLTVGDGRKLSFSDANTGLSAALYDDSSWPTLARGLLNLAQGDGRIMMALADLYFQRDSTGQYSNLIDGFNAIRCLDSTPVTDPAKITALNAQVIKVAPAQWNGDPAGAVADTCAYWPFEPTWVPHRLSIPTMPKALVISTKGDPATPYADGVELSQQIPSVLLSVAGTRHTAFLQGITCVDQIGVAYLETLQLPTSAGNC